MFTVKHINIGGDENLYQSETVHYEPRHEGPVSASDISPYVHLDDAMLTGGTIFVMNASGKTVARYDLGASPVPHLGSVNEPKTWREPGTAHDPVAGMPQTIAA